MKECSMYLRKKSGPFRVWSGFVENFYYRMIRDIYRYAVQRFTINYYFPRLEPHWKYDFSKLISEINCYPLETIAKARMVTGFSFTDAFFTIIEYGGFTNLYAGLSILVIKYFLKFAIKYTYYKIKNSTLFNVGEIEL